MEEGGKFIPSHESLSTEQRNHMTKTYINFQGVTGQKSKARFILSPVLCHKLFFPLLAIVYSVSFVVLVL